MRISSISWLVGASIASILNGCRPSDVLSTPTPDGIVTSTSVNGQSSAEGVFYGARQRLFNVFSSDSYVLWSGALADEFIYPSNLDARETAAVSGWGEYGDNTLLDLLSARSQLLVAEPLLQKYEQGAGLPRIGEALALAGYAELFMAEGYCAGITLSAVLPGGGYVYGTPLTTDSLLGTAEAHFDSALAHANGNDTITALASVGLGRARLDRGNFASAATAVQNVPTAFVYNSVSATTSQNGNPDFYEYPLFYNTSDCFFGNTSNVEGTNGLNFVSADDPRLMFDSTIAETCDGFFYSAPDSVWYYPVKFGNPSQFIPIATGAEARLIEAEAALQTGDVPTWATDLNTLRANAPTTYLQLDSAVHALSADSTTGATPYVQIDVMFRERAFWLFSTGTRLGDLRRLIRQYHRDQSVVFPVGNYLPESYTAASQSWPSPLTTYGKDVNMTLPTPASQVPVTNPNYKGCITSTETA